MEPGAASTSSSTAGARVAGGCRALNAPGLCCCLRCPLTGGRNSEVINYLIGY